MSIKAAYYTGRGHVRPYNEDALSIAGLALGNKDMTLPFYLEIDAIKAAFCVIDGMGGYAGGAVAAGITAGAFAAAALPGEEIKLGQILGMASEGIREAVRGAPNLASMGATLAGIEVDAGRGTVLAFNVGDCRAYRYRGGFLDKLTHDHSRVQELFDSGEISEEEMRTHPKKNIVIACVTALDITASDYYSREYAIEDGDEFFVCSDGVWEALPIDEMERSLAAGGVEDACCDLQKKLMATACADNVSFILIGDLPPVRLE